MREPGSSGAHVWTVPAVASDGGTVYFTAFAALAPGAPALTEARSKAPVNLYRYDTETGAVTFVATVATSDYPSEFVPPWFGGGGTDEVASDVALESRANWYSTPEGRYLLFSSSAELTGYDTAEGHPGHTGDWECPTLGYAGPPFGHCSEVYRYDAKAAENGEPSIICVSCDRSGAPPVSNAFFATSAGPYMPAGGAVRAMSDNGSYAFFDSADPLVPQATSGSLHVYEWEARGTGGCTLAQGCAEPNQLWGGPGAVVLPRREREWRQRVLWHPCAPRPAGHRHGRRHIRCAHWRRLPRCRWHRPVRRRCLPEPNAEPARFHASIGDVRRSRQPDAYDVHHDHREAKGESEAGREVQEGRGEEERASGEESGVY